MRVCVISPGVVHAIPRTMALADQFDEVHFIDVTGTADREALASTGVIYHGPADIGAPIIKSRRIPGLFREIKPDVIICHYSSGDHYFSSIAYNRCPVAVIAMGNDVLYDEGDTVVPGIMRLLIRMALRLSCYIGAKSQFLAARVVEYGVTAPIHVNYWGSDINRFHPGERLEARLSVGLDERKTIILSSRNMEPRLNIHLVVEAFHAVQKTHDNTLLVLLGRSMPEYRKQVEDTINRLKIADKVLIVGDVPQDVLPKYYLAADVAVSMALCEGFPNTLLEVMACKVPIVVGRIAQIEELLENDKNAWICDIEPQSIAAAILDVLDDDMKSSRISSSAYHTAMEFADIRKNAITFSDNLKNICANHKHVSRLKVFIFRMLYFMYRAQRKLFTV